MESKDLFVSEDFELPKASFLNVKSSHEICTIRIALDFRMRLQNAWFEFWPIQIHHLRTMRHGITHRRVDRIALSWLFPSNGNRYCVIPRGDSGICHVLASRAVYEVSSWTIKELPIPLFIKDVDRSI